MIPGINLLNVALGVIGSQPVVYFRDSGQRETLANGNLKTVFEEGKSILSGSVQAMPKEKVIRQGLEESFDYVEWFVSQSVIGDERDYSGDEIKWNGKRWKVGSVEDWSEQDGWCVATCQEVKIKRVR